MVKSWACWIIDWAMHSVSTLTGPPLEIVALGPHTGSCRAHRARRGTGEGPWPRTRKTWRIAVVRCRPVFGPRATISRGGALSSESRRLARDRVHGRLDYPVRPGLDRPGRPFGHS